MSYNYERQKPELFTPQGVKVLLTVRDTVNVHFKAAGCCTVSAAIKSCAGDTWTMLAAIDYLIELGEVRRVVGSGRSQNDVLMPT